MAMRAIARAALLREPSEADLSRHESVRRGHYAAAYGWPALPLPPGERRKNRTMRHHIRGWITQWDMLRLERQTVGIDVDQQRQSYDEDPDLASPPPDPDGES